MPQNAKSKKRAIKVTRRLKPPPEPLGGILKIVELVPHGVDLPPLELREYLPGIVSDLPELRAWLRKSPDSPDDVHANPRYRYQLVRSWVQTLRAIVRGEQANQIPLIAIPDHEKNGIRLDNRLIEALSTLKLSRLRECLICQKIFWARRSDARQCGDPKCKSALSSRLQRDPDLRAVYYQNRKEREYRKEQAAKKRAKKVPKH